MHARTDLENNIETPSEAITHKNFFIGTIYRPSFYDTHWSFFLWYSWILLSIILMDPSFSDTHWYCNDTWLHRKGITSFMIGHSPFSFQGSGVEVYNECFLNREKNEENTSGSEGNSESNSEGKAKLSISRLLLLLAEILQEVNGTHVNFQCRIQRISRAC